MATQMDFCRRSTGKSRLEKICNETIRETMNVKKNIIQMIEEKQLSWVGHVMCMEHERLSKHVFEWESEGKQRRGRPRKTWISGVKC